MSIPFSTQPTQEQNLMRGVCVCLCTHVCICLVCMFVCACGGCGGVGRYSIDQNTSFNIPIAEIQLDVSGTVARSHREIGWEQALKEGMA